MKKQLNFFDKIPSELEYKQIVIDLADWGKIQEKSKENKKEIGGINDKSQKT